MFSMLMTAELSWIPALCGIVIFHISYSYLNFLRRVALRQKPFFKGPSGKKLNYSIQLNLNMTRIKKKPYPKSLFTIIQYIQ